MRGLARAWRRIVREAERQTALRRFGQQRLALADELCRVAATHGKPRGLAWVGCELWRGKLCEEPEGDLAALVEVTLRFAAIPGEGMEDVPAVSEARHATALYHYRHGRWGTGGRVLFNLTPTEALERLGDLFQPIQDFDLGPNTTSSERQ